MMKKEAFSFNPLGYFVLIGLCLLGILFGAFFDKAISDSIVNTSSSVGGFVETIGLVFSYSMILLGGVLLFKGIFSSPKKIFKALGIFLFLICFSLAVYFSAHSLTDSRGKDVTYGMVFSPFWSYFIAFLFSFCFSFLFFFFIKSDDKRLLIILGIIILAVMLSQYLFVGLMKKLACRPRYRFLIDPSLNGEGESFASFYQFHPFSHSDDYHKSFPSGHTTTSAVTLLLPLISKVLRYPFKGSSLVLFSLSLTYTLFIAFFRVLYGAHFLSDVSFGCLFTLLFILVFLFLGNRFYFQKKENKTMKENQ